MHVSRIEWLPKMNQFDHGSTTPRFPFDWYPFLSTEFVRIQFKHLATCVRSKQIRYKYFKFLIFTNIHILDISICEWSYRGDVATWRSLITNCRSFLSLTRRTSHSVSSLSVETGFIVRQILVSETHTMHGFHTLPFAERFVNCRNECLRVACAICMGNTITHQVPHLRMRWVGKIHLSFKCVDTRRTRMIWYIRNGIRIWRIKDLKRNADALNFTWHRTNGEHQKSICSTCDARIVVDRSKHLNL